MLTLGVAGSHGHRWPISYNGWVPLLSAADALPYRPRRVLVVGTSASGKTTLAARISAGLGVRHVEIDALFHGPGWTARATFEAEVDAFSLEPGWVTEWQYSVVRERLAQRADLVVWLDLRRVTVMRRVVRRTLRRRLRREVLWNGNVEPPLWTVFTDREHIVRWAWSTHRKSAQRIAALRKHRPDLPIVRLCDSRGVEQWISGPLRHAATLPASRG
jgi:adenylate kinase family enzyme